MEKKIRIKGEVILRNISDDFILVPVNGSLASEGMLFRINETASLIWQYISESDVVTVDHIINHISDICNMDKTLIAEDIKGVIKVFINSSLLEEVP